LAQAATLEISVKETQINNTIGAGGKCGQRDGFTQCTKHSYRSRTWKIPSPYSGKKFRSHNIANVTIASNMLSLATHSRSTAMK